jgi:competence protein ComEC
VAWEWDGVAFEVLHPAPAAYRDRRRENDRSCVIRVATSGGAALLAADIERLAEAELVARAGPALAADVLVVPHHGSRTSSIPAFVEAVSPAYALVSAGWRNRFNQPSPEVVARYRSRGALVLRTDLQGALRARLPARQGMTVDAGPLVTEARYWSDRRPAKTFP